MGDMNRPVRQPVRLRERTLRPCNAAPTAWNLDGHGYSVAVDNVLIDARTRQVGRAQRLGDPGSLLPTDRRLRELTSDHSPVAARLFLG